MKKFDQLYENIMAAAGNTTAGAFGSGQAHPAQPGQSGDFYAPGDARNIWGSGKKKKKKAKVIRRTFPKGL
jgi:hypothetical protein